MGSTSPDGDLPYWQVNVPPSEREAECPDFLRDLSDKDRGIVGTRDADFRPDSWADLRRKIETNRLDLLRRVPSMLRLYLAYNRKIARQHGSVMAFVLSQRLRWEPPIVARGRPFEFPEDDVKILWNDWPYGVDHRVVHLVVWTKFPFEEDPVTGDLTDAARAEIEEFVVKTFGQSMPRDRYLWFKNWASLKSIQAVEHFHVMLYDPDPELVNTLTHGDIPLSERVKRQERGDV